MFCLFLYLSSNDTIIFSTLCYAVSRGVELFILLLALSVFCKNEQKKLLFPFVVESN
jgi:hypothetical protein